MPRLIVIKGADEGKQFELTEPVQGVGRDASNRIRLHDTEVSRRHAEFRKTAEGYRLTDIGSANGSFVNNQPVTDVLLQPGDRVQIGQTLLVYSAAATGADAPSDLADRISMIARSDLDFASAVVKTIGEAEGSRILARPESVEGQWLKAALANLGVMYEVTQAVSHILDLNQLLEKIMDLIFRSLEADRGCVMLRNPDNGQFEPKALRWRESVPRQEKMTLSRTVMEHVLREKEGVLVSDASRDERFNTGQSILRFGIREVICVPMKGRHETLGVLYLDTRSSARELVAANNPEGKFTEDHLKLAAAIAHQAALAVEETRYYQAMVQAERLAAIGQTVAALSHHIKNILQGLRTGKDLLKMGIADRDEALILQGWKSFEKNQGKIEDLVLDMLNYSKDREPSVEETDLNALLEDVVELMQGRAAELKISLESRPLPTLPRVPADREGIHRALLNVVSNALDAVESREKPQVVVGTTLEPDGAWVRLHVLDNGTGIPPEKLAEIFKPFVSTKGSRGTGLGLAVSRKILREHGGDILVKSQVGKGSQFILRLPLKSPLSPDAAASKDSIPIPPEPN